MLTLTPQELSLVEVKSLQALETQISNASEGISESAGMLNDATEQLINNMWKNSPNPTSTQKREVPTEKKLLEWGEAKDQAE